MSKTTSFVAALGAFGALAYLLNPLPPDPEWAAKVATTSQGTVGPAPAVSQPAAPENPAPTAARPPAQDATVRLVQQIQTELLRLGCYAGTVDGHWTPETQQAMHVLGERVRVLRPVETPDYIMLAFARSQSSHVCTARDRATAAARVSARVVPSAARGAAPLQPRADRAPMAADAPRGRVTSRRDESRTAPVEVRTAERAAPDPDDDDPVLPRDRSSFGEARMGLGVAHVDPLRAGMDPRDPSAPAVLRGPGQPAPVGAVAELTPPPVARRAERDWRPAPPRSDWKRTIFSRMRENGP